MRIARTATAARDHDRRRVLRHRRRGDLPRRRRRRRGPRRVDCRPSRTCAATPIIEAARRTGADAVHPGYGFLAENAEFAQAVIDAGLVWVGPTPDQIRTLGDKLAAKRAAIAAGVPTLHGDTYPLLVKAAAGGGGRGMRIVRRPRRPRRGDRRGEPRGRVGVR